MALPTITVSDFLGTISTNQNEFRQVKQSSYIDSLYPQTIDNLLGVAFTTEVQNADPLPQKYIDLFFGGGDPYFNLCQEKLLRKPVLLDTVKKILYAYWVRDDSINTTSGQSVNDVQNATMLNRNQLHSDVSQRYNMGIMYFNSQVIDFLDNYKDYKSAITGVNNLGGMLTEVLTSDTIYLSDGDTVVIDKQEYIVSNVVANTSFRVTATFLTTPTSFIYNPYELLEYEHQKLILF